MKSNADMLLTNASGEIPKQAFTGEQSGLFGKQYLAGPPVYDRLEEDEQIHYLLVNRSSGVMIESRNADGPRAVTPGSEYRALAVITNQRVFFVIGGEPEDTLIEIPASDVTGAEHRGSLLSTTILIKSDADHYSFSVKKRGSSDPREGVSYIQRELVPVTAEVTEAESANADGTSEQSESEPETEKQTAEEGEVATAVEAAATTRGTAGDMQGALQWADGDEEAATTESASSESTPTPDPETGDEPTSPRENARTDETELLEAIERVADELGKAPTITEFSDRTEYSTTAVYSHFDAWADAIEAASIEGLSRQALLEDLERLEDELGYPPLYSDVEEHGYFSTHDYRREFGSVDSAREEMGSSLVDHVMETLREVVAKSDGRPAMSDFEAASPYSAGVIYKVFDSWDDALAAVEDEQGAEEATTVVQNELSERYELLRNLRSLCQVVVDIREERLDDNLNDSMDRWLSEIGSCFSDGGTNEKAYGAQQRDRNPFAMKKYREEFGNGERVTDFEHVQTELPSPSLQALLAQHVENIEEIDLPVDETTGTVFPVLVQSEVEADRAIEMLDRLPAHPSAAEADVENGSAEPTNEDSETTNGGKDLLEISGVTDDIADSLEQAGYETRADLREASMEAIADVDSLTEQIAMRIKLDVGE